MKKIYVLDTNVLIYDPTAIFKFEDNDVVLPITIIKEIDSFKGEMSERGRNAREIARILDGIRNNGSLIDGVKLPSGGILYVKIVESYDKNASFDEQILNTALSQKQETDMITILVSMDINLRLMAEASGLEAEDYKNQSTDSNKTKSNIREEKIPMNFEVHLLFQDGVKPDFEMKKHECFILLREDGKQYLAREKNGLLIGVDHKKETMGIKPRNVEQAFAMSFLLDDDIKLVTIVGKAGSGKTLISSAAGLYKVTEEMIYDKLLISRPIVPMGRDIGFLPGTAEEKVMPYMRPIFDNIDYILMPKGKRKKISLDGLINEGALEIEPLTYIRGRSIPHQFMIVDECLTENHLISMSDGSVKSIKDIRKDDCVVSVNDNNLPVGIVDGTISRKSKTISLKFRTSTLTCTKNHPLYVFRDFNFEKVRADSIEKNDFIACPRFLPYSVKNNIDSNLSYFIGYILCDGHVSKNLSTIKVGFKKDIDHTINIFKKGVKSLVSDNAKINKNNKGGNIFSFNDKEIITKICNEFNIPYGNKSSTIDIPDVIFTSNDDAKKSFIRSCFDAEGDVNVSNSSLVLNFNSVSEKFTKKLSILLRHFGIISSFYEIKNKRYNNGSTYRLSIIGYEAELFIKSIKFGLDRKQNLAMNFVKNNGPHKDCSKIPITNLLIKRLKEAGYKTRDPLLENIRHSNTCYKYNILNNYKQFLSNEELNFINNYYFDNISNITINDEEVDVYDFRVPNFGNFIVDGLMSSNCQNLSPHEIKTIITRCGEETKLVLTGDIAQIDSPYMTEATNGLTYVINKLQNNDLVANIKLEQGERSPLANLAAENL